jgi:predicted nucleic acid-binding protein
MRLEGMQRDKAAYAMRLASEALQGGEHAVDDEAVLELLTQSKCSAYDCEFVALANALKTVLVTEDKALLKAFPKVCRLLTEANAGKLTRA